MSRGQCDCTRVTLCGHANTSLVCMPSLRRAATFFDRFYHGTRSLLVLKNHDRTLSVSSSPTHWNASLRLQTPRLAGLFLLWPPSPRLLWPSTSLLSSCMMFRHIRSSELVQPAHHQVCRASTTARTPARPAQRRSFAVLKPGPSSTRIHQAFGHHTVRF